MKKGLTILVVVSLLIAGSGIVGSAITGFASEPANKPRINEEYRENGWFSDDDTYGYRRGARGMMGEYEDGYNYYQGPGRGMMRGHCLRY